MKGIRRTIKVAVVRFPANNQHYNYRYEDLSLEAGDLVVVKSRDPYSFGVAEVVEVKKISPTPLYSAFVIQKLDRAALEDAAAFLEGREKRREEILAEMEERRALMEEMKKYAELVETDESAKALLNELIELG